MRRLCAWRRLVIALADGLPNGFTKALAHTFHLRLFIKLKKKRPGGHPAAEHYLVAIRSQSVKTTVVAIPVESHVGSLRMF